MAFPDVLTCEASAVAVGKGIVALLAFIMLLTGGARAGVLPERLVAQSVYRIDCTHMVSHPCGYAGVFSEYFFAQSAFHIDCTHKASHPCGYACVLSERLRP